MFTWPYEMYFSLKFYYGSTIKHIKSHLVLKPHFYKEKKCFLTTFTYIY